MKWKGGTKQQTTTSQGLPSLEQFGPFGRTCRSLFCFLSFPFLCWGFLPLKSSSPLLHITICESIRKFTRIPTNINKQIPNLYKGRASSSYSIQIILLPHKDHISLELMDRRLKKKQARRTSSSCWSDDAEVSSIEWEFINMSDQEEDLIYRMYKLVGDRWGLIAGRIPGRKAEEIERFWIMRHGEVFADGRIQRQQQQQKQQQQQQQQGKRHVCKPC